MHRAPWNIAMVLLGAILSALIISAGLGLFCAGWVSRDWNEKKVTVHPPATFAPSPGTWGNNPNPLAPVGPIDPSVLNAIGGGHALNETSGLVGLNAKDQIILSLPCIDFDHGALHQINVLDDGQTGIVFGTAGLRDGYNGRGYQIGQTYGHSEGRCFFISDWNQNPYSTTVLSIKGDDHDKVIWGPDIEPVNDGHSWFQINGGDVHIAHNNNLYVDGSTRTASVILTGPPPSSSNSPGTPGQIAYDSRYIYICVAKDTWKRAEASSW